MVQTATCPLCEASCGILVDTDGQHIRSIRGDDDDPFSRGYICPKAAALADLHDDPDRIRAPMIREGSRWRDGLVGGGAGPRGRRSRARPQGERTRCGGDVLRQSGRAQPRSDDARAAVRAALRTKNVYSASSADQLPQMLAAFRMFGHLALIPVPDLDRTDYFLILGANPVVSNGSLMTAPDMKGRLRAIRDRGGRVVVVDPRRTETAGVADEHVAIRPGTDALLLAAMLHVVFAEGWVRLGRLEGRVKNVDALADLVGELTPERVARRTGVAPEVTRRLAGEFARATRAACYGRVGLCTQRHGTLASWLVQALNLLTGHLDEAGGMMLTTPAVDAVAILSRLGLRGTYDRWRSRARQLPEFGGDLPVAALADEIEMPGRGRVRALVTVAGNPVLSAPNGRRLDRALGTLDHVVSIDGYLNETTRHAHVLLPPAPPLARPHYDFALYAFAVRNVAKYSDAVIPRTPAERHDWEILAELAGRVFAPRPLRGIARRAARSVRPERILDLLLRIGPHRLTLAKLRRHPHGMDLGPLEPGRVGDRIATPDRQVDAAPAEFLDDARAQLLVEADREPGGELVLIGRRQLRDNNSWMHNASRLVKGPPRCTLLVHPTDAASRHLADGDAARLDVGGGLDRRADRSDRRDAPGRRQPAARLGSRSRRRPPRRGARARRRERQRRDERAASRHAQRQRRLQRPGRHAAARGRGPGARY